MSWCVPDSGMNTIAELVARAKAAPGTFNYSSPGAGTKSHLTGEELKQRAAIEMTHIPYRGAGPAALAALEGTVQVASVALPAAEPLVQSGQLRGLAVTGAKRWPSLPNVPTMIEAGYPGFISDTFSALFAPAGTPPDDRGAAGEEVPRRFRQRESAARPRSLPASRWLPARRSNWRRGLRSEIPAVKALVARAGIEDRNRARTKKSPGFGPGDLI